MCRAVLEALAGAGYALTDYEALLFLPAVVEKSGHNQVGRGRCSAQVGLKRKAQAAGQRAKPAGGVTAQRRCRVPANI